MPFLAEAMRAYEEGLGTAEDIDTGARVGLNHPMGPLELADFIGLDVCLRIMEVLDEASASRTSAAADARGAGRRRPPRPEDRPRLLHLPAQAAEAASGAPDRRASGIDPDARSAPTATSTSSAPRARRSASSAARWHGAGDRARRRRDPGGRRAGRA